EAHQRLGAVARDVDELAAAREIERRPRGQPLDRSQRAFAEVAFVKPPRLVFNQRAGEPFAVEIDPLRARAVERHRQGLRARDVNLVDSGVYFRLRITELDLGVRARGRAAPTDRGRSQ